MAHLYRAYARPLQVFLRQRGESELEAEELVHGFIAHALATGLLRHVAPQEARFRSFLLKAMSNWLIKQHRHASAQKRGGNAPHEPLQDDDGAAGLEFAEEGGSESAGRAYDGEWARTLVERAMSQLRAAHERRGRMALFEALAGLLPGGGEVRPYAVIAVELGMTEGAVRKAAHGLRASCAEFLRAEVASTVAEPGMVDEELRYLLQLLRTAI